MPIRVANWLSRAHPRSKKIYFTCEDAGQVLKAWQLLVSANTVCVCWMHGGVGAMLEIGDKKTDITNGMRHRKREI